MYRLCKTCRINKTNGRPYTDLNNSSHTPLRNLFCGNQMLSSNIYTVFKCGKGQKNVGNTCTKSHHPLGGIFPLYSVAITRLRWPAQKFIRLHARKNIYIRSFSFPKCIPEKPHFENNLYLDRIMSFNLVLLRFVDFFVCH